MEISDYFEVVSTEDSVLHLRLKGLWTTAITAQISATFMARFRDAVDSMGGRQFLVLADTTSFKPPSMEAQAAVSQAMLYAREHNLYKTVEVVPTAVARLAFKQAAKKTGKDDFRVVVTSVEDGWVEIEKLRQSRGRQLSCA